jgi:AcrR family transcriptional regulator
MSSPVAVSSVVDTATETTLGQRERKKIATRRAIVAAAQELVIERGLDATTVDEMCERAGIARRTFFNYFETKDDAAIGAHGELVPRTAAARFAAGGPTGSLHTDTVALAAGILETADFTVDEARRKVELVRAEPKLLARQVWRFERELTFLTSVFVERAQHDAAHLDPDVGAFAVINLVRSTFRLWETADSRGEVVDHLPRAVAQLRHVLGVAQPS